VGRKRARSGVGVRMGAPGKRLGSRLKEAVAVPAACGTVGRLGVVSAPDGDHAGESDAVRTQETRRRRKHMIHVLRRME